LAFQTISRGRCTVKQPSSLQVKVGHTHDELRLRILNAVSPALRNLRINSDEQHAIFAQELQSALMPTVLFEWSL